MTDVRLILLCKVGKGLVRTHWFSIEAVLEGCRRWLAHPASVVLPSLWFPPSVDSHLEVVNTSQAVVTALQTSRLSLDELTWQQLEDLVAELLRARGLQVSVTSRSNDGGRDIVARGELIPGEPTVLAVEVKHRPLVRLPDARNALWANRSFPLLMIATSGRFSAGVVREKQQAETWLRLLLKDGVALREWINQYRSGGGA